MDRIYNVPILRNLDARGGRKLGTDRQTRDDINLSVLIVMVNYKQCFPQNAMKMNFNIIIIIESVDSINRGERGFPLTQYITNGGISRARYAITYLKHHHRVLRRISNRMCV